MAKRKHVTDDDKDDSVDDLSDEVAHRKRKKKAKKKKREKENDDDKARKKLKKSKASNTYDDDDESVSATSPLRSPRTVAESSDESESETAQEREGAFKNFRICACTVAGLEKRGISHLFPIQAKTFNFVYDGRDVLAQARTGSGKTISFALPVVESLRAAEIDQKHGRAPQVLALAPTRELARQVAEEFRNLGGRDLYTYCIYGGVPYDAQESAISSGIDVLVGTPGRLRDHVERFEKGRRGGLDLTQLRVIILDEADRMLEQGFSETVEYLLEAAFAGRNTADLENGDSNKKSKKKKNKDKVGTENGLAASAGRPQVLLFSATVPSWVEDVAKRFTRKPKRVDLIGDSKLKTSETVQHKAVRCRWQDRAAVLGDIIQVYSGQHGRCIIFTQTKADANALVLDSAGSANAKEDNNSTPSKGLRQEAQVLHGDIPQRQREQTLRGFREGRFHVLVATDVAARGIDIPEIDLVVQCEPPKDVAAYIHRSGRTGRAGRAGVSILFYKPGQESLLRYVEKMSGVHFQQIGTPQPAEILKAAARDAAQSLDSVSPDVCLHFRSTAEQLVAERGAVDTMAAALALISGVREIKSRSLLSGQENFTTYIMRNSTEFRFSGYMWKALERLLPDVKPEVRGMRTCLDMKGVVFDVPDWCNQTIREQWADTEMTTLEVCDSLPPLVNQDFSRPRGSGSNTPDSRWRSPATSREGSPAHFRRSNGFRGGFGGFGQRRFGSGQRGRGRGRW